MRTIVRADIVAPLVIAAAVFASTVGAQATSVPPHSSKVQRLKPNANLITHEQLESRTFPNAYAAIEALRGNWLRPRNLNPPAGTVYNAPAGSPGSAANAASSNLPREQTGIKVYIDGVRAGGLEALKAIPTVTVYTMRRINGTEAQARFGVGHSDGVIFVATGPDKGGDKN